MKKADSKWKESKETNKVKAKKVKHPIKLQHLDMSCFPVSSFDCMGGPFLLPHSLLVSYPFFLTFSQLSYSYIRGLSYTLSVCIQRVILLVYYYFLGKFEVEKKKGMNNSRDNHV